MLQYCHNKVAIHARLGTDRHNNCHNESNICVRTQKHTLICLSQQVGVTCKHRHTHTHADTHTLHTHTQTCILAGVWSGRSRSRWGCSLSVSHQSGSETTSPLTPHGAAGPGLAPGTHKHTNESCPHTVETGKGQKNIRKCSQILIGYLKCTHTLAYTHRQINYEVGRPWGETKLATSALVHHNQSLFGLVHHKHSSIHRLIHTHTSILQKTYTFLRVCVDVRGVWVPCPVQYLATCRSITVVAMTTPSLDTNQYYQGAS